MDSRRVLVLLALTVTAFASSYPVLLASYPADTIGSLHSGVYIQAMTDLADSPALEGAVSIVVPIVPTHETGTLRLRGAFTVHWQCNGGVPSSVDVTLRVLANSFACEADAIVCPTDRVLTTFPLNFAEALASAYPPSLYGTTVKVRVPFDLEVTLASAQAWAQLGIVWLAPLVTLPLHSAGSELRNEIRWVASKGPTPPQWETSYAVRDQHDILGQNWVNWTTHGYDTDHYFGFLSQPPALALEAYLDKSRVLAPIPPPRPTVPLPVPENTTLGTPTVPPPWFLPVPPVPSVPSTPSVSSPSSSPVYVASPRRELFTAPAVAVALVVSVAFPGCLALVYTVGRERRYDGDVPIDKYLDALGRGHYDSGSDNDSMAELSTLDDEERLDAGRLRDVF